MAVYDTSYREGEVVATAACTAGGLEFCSIFDHGHRPSLVGVASEMSSSSAVTFCRTEHYLLLNSTMTCVGWLAEADCRPGPLTWQV